MKDNRIENEQFEGFLRKAQLPEASPELKQRITAKSQKAWNQTAGEVSWRIPFRRLVSAAAAAVIIVSLTNYSSDRALQKWRSGESFTVSAEHETLPEVPYGPFAKNLATVGRKTSMINASALRDHVETVRRILDESQPNGTPASLVPRGGSSRLFPGRHGIGSYS